MSGPKKHEQYGLDEGFGDRPRTTCDGGDMYVIHTGEDGRHAVYRNAPLERIGPWFSKRVECERYLELVILYQM